MVKDVFEESYIYFQWKLKRIGSIILILDINIKNTV